MPERAGQLAQDRVAEHHRGELAAAEHVAPDRDDVAGEVLDDALVEALVAPAQQRQRGLAGELLHERLVEQAPARRQRDHAPAPAQLDRVDAVAGAQRGVEHVHAQHHPRAAAERRVVDLPAAQRRVLAEVHALAGASPPRARCATWRWAENHSNHSGNSVKTSIFTAPGPSPCSRPGAVRGDAEEVEVHLDPPLAARRRCGPRP